MWYVMILVILNVGVTRTIDLKGKKIYRKPSVVNDKGGMLLDLSKSNDILLVDDDGDSIGYPDLVNYYTTALDIYYSGRYDIYEVVTNGDGPDYSILSQYNAVIWFTGECWSSQYFATLTANDEANLAQYLNDGGNLLLCAQDYLYDRYPTAGSFTQGQFPYDYLGVASVSQDVWMHFGGTLNGTDAPFTGLSGAVYAPYSAGVPFWTDDLTPIADASICLQADTAGMTANCGVKYESVKGFKTIFTTLGFEGITDVNTRAEFLKAALEWFGITAIEEKTTIPEYKIEVIPSFNRIKILFAQNYRGNLKVKIYSITGRKIVERNIKIDGKNAEIKFEKLKPGIYGWSIETEREVINGKFAVVR